MSADVAAFVDTNVLVYAVSNDEPEKQRLAREIVARGFTEGCFAIGTQVMLEAYVNITRKAGSVSPPATPSSGEPGDGAMGLSRSKGSSDRSNEADGLPDWAGWIRRTSGVFRR